MRTAYQCLLVKEEKESITVSLNRPEQRNALNALLIQELTECFEELKASPVRFVLLQGEGKVFCAGADVNWMKEAARYSYEENREDAHKLFTMFETIRHFPKPLVTVVQGGAYGGGLGFLAISDIVIAEAQASFCFGETRLGLVAAVVSAFVVPKIGLSAAQSLFIPASSFDASRAYAVGLVHYVAEDRASLGKIKEKIARDLLSCSPQAMEATKALLLKNFGKIDGETMQNCIETIARIRISKEAQAGLKAFLEKQAPPWKKNEPALD